MGSAIAEALAVPATLGEAVREEGTAMATRPLDVDRSAMVLTPAVTSRGEWPVYVGVGASSAAVIVFEIVLTRIFAVSQFYHFAFMTVSLALLGFGASGTALTVFPRLGRGGPRRWAALALAQAVTTLGAYLVINRLPFDSFSIAWDRRQILYLVGYYLALAVPFFFGGAVIGTLLAGWDQPHPVPSHRIYAASLVGSGAGALLALGGLSRLGGEGVVVLAASCALAAAAVFAIGAGIGRRRWVGAAAVLGAVLVIVWVASSSVLDVRLSPYKALSAVLRFPDAEVVSTDWNAASRVDLVTSESIRSLPGLSFTYLGSPPPQDGVTFDADDLSPIPRVDVAEADFVPHLLASLPFSLRPGAEALVLQPRGGLDVLVGLASGAKSIVAVEPNELAVAAAGAGAPDPYADPRVEVVVEEPRSYVERTPKEFDVIDLALTAPYRPVTSGAYSLAEDYSLTVEAFESYLDRLRPGGLLTAMRWLQTPPSEESRLIALAAEATRRSGADPEEAIVALRGYSTVLVIVQPDGFSATDMRALGSFAEERRFDLVAAPGLEASDANRYNVLPQDDYFTLAAELEGEEPEALYERYEFAVAPPTDDHPFFGHFFKWDQASAVLDSLGRSWQPFGGAGYFVLVLLLALVTVAAFALIVTPLLVARLRRGGQERVPAGIRSWTVAYFGFLGVGFLFVEIPIVQRYILLVGRPTMSLALVLFVLLIASGLGALASRRLPWRPMAVTLAVAVLIYPWLITRLTEAALSAPLSLRMAAGGVVLFPLGFVMGTMFPKGLARLEASAPQLVPWAWGVNGVMSVISAVASALLALTFGFTTVMLAGAACYGACALLVPRSAASEHRALSPRPG